MPLYKVTLKSTGNSNNIRYEKGMNVDVVTTTTSIPILNGGKEVCDAFMRIYGLDVKKAGLLSSSYMDYKQIG